MGRTWYIFKLGQFKMTRGIDLFGIESIGETADIVMIDDPEEISRINYLYKKNINTSRLVI
jgi:hypothetical protein